jgi:hypothetical protein
VVVILAAATLLAESAGQAAMGVAMAVSAARVDPVVVPAVA